MRLLLIEDNVRLTEYIGKAFKENGFTVDATHSVDYGEAALSALRYDAIILDLGLPDADGLSLLSLLRKRGDPTPVLVLTAREGTHSLVNSLNTGADDYLRKPFEMEELLARVRALLRRPGQVLGARLTEGNISLDTISREVLIEDAKIELGRRETDALELLMRRSGRVVSKAAMEESFYGFGEEVASNAIEVLMHRLRKRLQSVGANVFIHTLRGVGYLLSDKAPE
jgi:two-component system, OmpR family, response regulator QseB